MLLQGTYVRVQVEVCTLQWHPYQLQIMHFGPTEREESNANKISKHYKNMHDNILKLITE